MKIKRILYGTAVGILSAIALMIGTGYIFQMDMSIPALLNEIQGEPEFYIKVLLATLIIAVYVIPVIYGIKSGNNSTNNLWEITVIPILAGFFAIVAALITTLVINVTLGVIGAIFDTSTITGIVAVIALFIAFAAPAKVLVIMFE